MLVLNKWFCAALGLCAGLLALTEVHAEPEKRRCFDETYCLVVEQEADTLTFYVENLRPHEITLRIEADLQNLAGDVAFPFVATYPGIDRKEAFQLKIQDEAWHYTYRSTWAYGTVRAEHDDGYAYALPYRPREKYRVTQAAFGAFSHHDLHALDFGMPEGTPVVAAREGFVVAVQDDFTEAGLEEHYRRMANYVLIRHPDGTLARYAHLQPESAEVAVGEHVERGQMLARSGNTGFSKGPHLHFEVYTITPRLRKQTIPIRFRIGRRSVAALREGRAYRAVE